MDFRLGPKSDAFRAEVREFLDEHLDEETIERAHRTGTMHDKEFHRAIGEQGWLAATWPAEYGGQERDPFEMTALRDELRLAGAPTDGMGLSVIVCQTIRRVATEEQKADFLPRALAGEICMSLGYSEPDSGSDVASIKTTATRDGDEWVINGQKMFTTLAHVADYVFLLARTNHDVPKHKGLTMFLVPLDSPGIEIQPVHTVGGERTNATFYNDVRVSDHYRIGEVDRGWDVMTVALTFERGGFGLSEADRVWEQAVAWAEETRRARRQPGHRRPLRPRAARHHAHEQRGRPAARLPHLVRGGHRWAPRRRGLDAQALLRRVDDVGRRRAGRHARRRRAWSSGARTGPRWTVGSSTCSGTRRSPPSTGDQRDAALDHRRAGPRPPEVRPLTPLSWRGVRGPISAGPVRTPVLTSKHGPTG